MVGSRMVFISNFVLQYQVENVDPIDIALFNKKHDFRRDLTDGSAKTKHGIHA